MPRKVWQPPLGTVTDLPAEDPNSAQTLIACSKGAISRLDLILAQQAAIIQNQSAILDQLTTINRKLDTGVKIRFW